MLLSGRPAELPSVSTISGVGAVHRSRTSRAEAPGRSYIAEEEGIISSRIFVGNLNYETTQRELEELFSEVGEVTEVFLPSDRNTGRPRGFAFVELASDEAVQEAIEKFHDYELKGRALRVTEAEQRPPRAPRFMPHEGGGGFHRGGGGRGQNRPKPKGSRRNMRGKKRSL